MCPLSPGTPRNITLLWPRKVGRSDHAIRSTSGRWGTAHILAKTSGGGIAGLFRGERSAAASGAVIVNAHNVSTRKCSALRGRFLRVWLGAMMVPFFRFGQYS